MNVEDIKNYDIAMIEFLQQLKELNDDARKYLLIYKTNDIISKYCCQIIGESGYLEYFVSHSGYGTTPSKAICDVKKKLTAHVERLQQ